MNKIDTKEWKEFKIDDLFIIHPTNHYNLTNKELFAEEGLTPVIVNSAFNNGIGGYVPMKATEQGGIITFSDTTNAQSIFYQPNDFIGYSHVQGMYPKFGKISHNAMYFIATVFKSKALTIGYDYSNKFRRDNASALLIKLPAKKDDPDFEYMENYMKSIYEKSKQNIENLNKINNNKEIINTSKWKNYKIGELFEPLKTGYIGKNKKIGSATQTRDSKHNIPLTCAKYGDNGIMYWGCENDFITYSNVLAVIRDGAVSTGMVYAEKDKTGVYSHSYFIHLKDYEVSFETNLWLSCLLTKVIYPKYTREDTCIWERISKDTITLPTKNNKPDWEYMENYMKNILEKSKNKLAYLDYIK